MLASTSVEQNITEMEQDRQELLAVRQKEASEKRKNMIKHIAAR
jgi:hypothetical protein